MTSAKMVAAFTDATPRSIRAVAWAFRGKFYQDRQPPSAVQDLRPRRDYLHVDDLVALLVATMATGAEGTFNAGSGHSASVGEIIAGVERIVGIDKPIHCTGQVRPDEVLDVIADVSRAERELRWRPKVSLEEGLARTIGPMRKELAGLS